MAPVVHGLEEKYGDQINFVYLDIDDPAAVKLVREMEVFSDYVPVFFFIDAEGKLIGHPLVGGMPDGLLEQSILDVLAEAELADN